VYRLTRLSLGYSLLLDRDTISLNVLREVRNGITGPTLSSAQLQSTDTNGSVSWQHQLNEDLSLFAFFQYGTSESNQALTPTTHPLSASATLRKTLSDTLSIYARYTYSEGLQTSETVAGTESINLVAVGLLKSF
jgi:hypothetical protein